MRETSRWIALGLLFLLPGLPMAQPGNGSASTLVDKAISQYDQGELAEAERLALKGLSNADSLSQFEKFSLHKLLGFIAVANDDEEGAVRQFVSALSYNPTLTPDPITWSPKVRKVFERAREEHIRQMEIQRQHRFAIEAELCRRASLRSLYLPGGGQRLKGHKRKGTLLGVLFWASAAGFVYGQAILPRQYNAYLDATTPSQATRKWEDYRNTTYLVNVTGIITTGIYVYSFFDALWATPSSVPERD